jgi:hypothetical protein
MRNINLWSTVFPQNQYVVEIFIVESSADSEFISDRSGFLCPSGTAGRWSSRCSARKPVRCSMRVTSLLRSERRCISLCCFSGGALLPCRAGHVSARLFVAWRPRNPQEACAPRGSIRGICRPRGRGDRTRLQCGRGCPDGFVPPGLCDASARSDQSAKAPGSHPLCDSRGDDRSTHEKRATAFGRLSVSRWRSVQLEKMMNMKNADSLQDDSTKRATTASIE